MRSGIAFPHRQPHEAAHLRPLMDRLHDVMAAQPGRARVAVLAHARPPVRGAWNVQVFHGLADRGCSPRFLQRGRAPRLRAALNAPLARLRLPAPLLRPPARPGLRHSRYQQVNAYGPRWADLFEGMLRDAEVSRFGHTALNEAGLPHADPDGPLLWLPTWDARSRLGGANASSLEGFAKQALALAASGVPVLLKLHPLTVRHRQAAAGCGLPVALARGPGVRFAGLHAELAGRVPAFSPTDPGLAEWAHAPPPPADAAWARDLLYAPDPRRNDAFAARLRERATGGTR
ncbi:MAG: hypothetical protein LC623_04595 [Halobacteriales archaeon]|nr:hypothetical protein [Halobacteriales archaeon]